MRKRTRSGFRQCYCAGIAAVVAVVLLNRGDVSPPPLVAASPSPHVAVSPPPHVAVSPSPPVATSVSVVARLARTVDCRWADESAALRAGDPLAEHCRLEAPLGRGRDSLWRRCAGLLKGPASLEIRSGNSAGLTRGTLTVDNHTLESFDVFAPGMKYSLKSTELAVDVSAAGVRRCMFSVVA